MFGMFYKLLAIMVFAWVGSAHASLMASVTVDGREWLQPVDFVNHSWNDIAAVCHNNTGVCNGSLGGTDLTGWIWASLPDVNDLFTAMGIPGFAVDDESLVIDFSANSVWAPAFLDTFFPTFAENQTRQITGLMRHFFPVAVTGNVSDNVITPIGRAADAAITSIDYQLNSANKSSEYIGGWFYRANAEVLAPATLPLMGIGLAAVGMSHRRRRQPS
jgi:hypothetical protein